MSKSLLEQLPGIVAAGKRQAAQILGQLEGRDRVTPQTRELAIPSKDTAVLDLFRQAREETSSGDSATENGQPNRFIYDGTLLAMAALLAGDEDAPSSRGKIDLIYIDPSFVSKADYRTKITLPGTIIEQKPTVFEQFACPDTWADDTASYLAMITPRLVLMCELLADTCSIYVHLDRHVAHYVMLVLDDVFGIVWRRASFSGSSKARSKKLPVNHDVVHEWHHKNGRATELLDYARLRRNDTPSQESLL